MGKNVIDIERINDARPADHPFHAVRIMIIYVMMATDGYDMRAIGFAALGSSVCWISSGRGSGRC